MAVLIAKRAKGVKEKRKLLLSFVIGFQNILIAVINKKGQSGTANSMYLRKVGKIAFFFFWRPDWPSKQNLIFFDVVYYSEQVPRFQSKAAKCEI